VRFLVGWTGRAATLALTLALPLTLAARSLPARRSSLVTQTRYWNGWTPLIYAADYGRVETIKHLVDVHSVNVHARNVHGKTAFDVAMAERHKECAQVLLQYMIDRSPFFLGQRSRGERGGKASE